MVIFSDYKPDLLILLKLKYNVKLDFFVCEIKKPGCSDNRYKSDFIKIHREMKAMIDQYFSFLYRLGLRSNSQIP